MISHSFKQVKRGKDTKVSNNTKITKMPQLDITIWENPILAHNELFFKQKPPIIIYTDLIIFAILHIDKV